MQKFDKKLGQPSLLAFASPTITPSNHYKMYPYCLLHHSLMLYDRGMDSVKDANTSLILGRKIDSPQLRLGKDPTDRPHSGFYS